MDAICVPRADIIWHGGTEYAGSHILSGRTKDGSHIWSRAKFGCHNWSAGQLDILWRGRPAPHPNINPNTIVLMFTRHIFGTTWYGTAISTARYDYRLFSKQHV